VLDWVGHETHLQPQPQPPVPLQLRRLSLEHLLGIKRLFRVRRRMTLERCCWVGSSVVYFLVCACASFTTFARMCHPRLRHVPSADCIVSRTVMPAMCRACPNHQLQASPHLYRTSDCLSLCKSVWTQSNFKKATP